LYGEGKSLEVRVGQTVYIEKGERFKPTFPDGDTEYIPVCLPAFRPDRCIREDEPDSDVAQKLAVLHADGNAAKKPKTGYSEDSPPPIHKSEEDAHPEILYHMCERSTWEAAKSSGMAYFPPTFEVDGFTHATAVPSRLITTANHFYQDVVGEWVCLRFKRSALRALGIITRDEEAMPVGDKGVGEEWANWVCPHVIGGIPPQVVDAEFPMLRHGPTYTRIQGVTDVPRIFKLATASEVKQFGIGGKILSELDKKDNFVHLSDSKAPRVVANLFFKECQDLQLLELDATMLVGTTNWIIENIHREPSKAEQATATTTVHYMKKDGCVHVYGEAGVPVSAVMRSAPVPLGKDGAHVFPEWLDIDPVPRIFKLATASEAKQFSIGGKILSELDKKDNFVHLSDSRAPPVVASLFFKECQDLQLLELDAKLLIGPTKWIVEDSHREPSKAEQADATTTIHYMKPDGCVHVYGEAGVPVSAVMRSAHVPLGKDGVHVFPEWLDIDQVPRIFKLATASEAKQFSIGGKVLSELDKTDNFVHLSDPNAPRVVANLFFKECEDLQLLELDAKLLVGPVKWIVGKMGDNPPSKEQQAGAATTVHYLKPDGCVHVYGSVGVPVSAIIRSSPVPRGKDGVHVFPAWL